MIAKDLFKLDTKDEWGEWVPEIGAWVSVLVADGKPAHTFPGFISRKPGVVLRCWLTAPSCAEVWLGDVVNNTPITYTLNLDEALVDPPSWSHGAHVINHDGRPWRLKPLTWVEWRDGIGLIVESEQRDRELRAHCPRAHDVWLGELGLESRPILRRNLTRREVTPLDIKPIRR